MLSWEDQLRALHASVPTRINEARKIYQNLRLYLHRYHGGMPIGFLAAIAQYESGGRMGATGDASLDEVGIYQITASFPPKIGIPPSLRYQTEGNVFLGCLEYNLQAAELINRYRAVLVPGSTDMWKLARLSFAIGAAGTRKLLDSALSDGDARPGYCFGGIRSWVRRTGGIPLGSQSAGKVWLRVHAVDVQWQVGDAVFPAFPGPPHVIPSPSGISYKIPEESKGALATNLSLFAAAGLISIMLII